jgi:adenylate cyclase
MPTKHDYTSRAVRYTARFPLLTFVGIQINFWIIANLLLVSIMHMTSLIIGQTFQVSITGEFTPLLLLAVTLGVCYGLILGLTNYYLDQKLFRKLALGKIIIFKAVISLGVLILILVLLRYAFYELLILPTLPPDAAIANHEAWGFTFWLFVIYYFFMTLLISFINQVNKKYGPGVLVPLLLGKYRNPQEEERVFMFMDLKSSTTTAEKLGHLKYSACIRDCFFDINEVLLPFHAEVYQYVGDEIVVTWRAREGLENFTCIRFYFACRKQFRDKAAYYQSHYGLLPEFKAGLHVGKVSAVEIGEIKRDIAYHGDILNTASRIQSVCNQFNKDFLVSEELLERIGTHPNLKTEPLGMILLRGKTAEIAIASVEWVD